MFNFNGFFLSFSFSHFVSSKYAEICWAFSHASDKKQNILSVINLVSTGLLMVLFF